jgi:hypothetical protein
MCQTLQPPKCSSPKTSTPPQLFRCSRVSCCSRHVLERKYSHHGTPTSPALSCIIEIMLESVLHARVLGQVQVCQCGSREICSDRPVHSRALHRPATSDAADVKLRQTNAVNARAPPTSSVISRCSCEMCWSPAYSRQGSKPSSGCRSLFPRCLETGTGDPGQTHKSRCVSCCSLDVCFRPTLSTPGHERPAGLGSAAARCARADVVPRHGNKTESSTVSCCSSGDVLGVRHC